MESHPPAIWSTAWFEDSAAVKRTLTVMADSISTARLGAGYPGGSSGASCDEFHGQSYSTAPEDYWLFRCADPSFGGNREDLYYEVVPDSAPSMERVRWVIVAPPNSAPRSWRDFRSALATRLSRSWGSSGGGNDEGALHGSLGSLTIRLNQTATSVGSLEIELRTDRLEKAFEQQDWNAGESDYWNPDPYRPERLSAQVGALRAKWPALAAAVSADSAKSSYLFTMAAALRESGRSHLDRGDRDLLLFTAHTWFAWYASSIRDQDSTRALALRKQVREFGATVETMPDVMWCYRSAGLDSLASRAGQDRWTDEAFLLRMSQGWEAPCSLCGEDTRFGPDEWKEVIRRGEDFLNVHPDSPIASKVTLRLAEAHETAWSLSKTGNVREEYIDPAPYRLDAPAHRSEAMRLYERFLSAQPNDPQAPAIRRRLGRMRLDVDTAYHRFWCVWD